MKIEAKNWNTSINNIDKFDILKFQNYLFDNPYKPKIFDDDFVAFKYSMDLAHEKLSKLGNYGEICINIISRELKLYDQVKIAARSNFINKLTKLDKISFEEICNETESFISPKLSIRLNETKINWIDGSVLAIYPKLQFLENGLMELKLNYKENQIIHAYLNALKIMIIHPFDDGNGRVARMIVTAALIKSLKLDFVPFLEPFLRARNNDIARTIQNYLITGDVIPFLFAFSGAVRDGIELRNI